MPFLASTPLQFYQAACDVAHSLPPNVLALAVEELYNIAYTAPRDTMAVRIAAGFAEAFDNNAGINERYMQDYASEHLTVKQVRDIRAWMVTLTNEVASCTH